MLIAVLASTAVLAGNGTADAQTSLVNSSPRQGQTFTDAPREVTLSFANAVRLPDDPISVTGPGSVQWSVGHVSVLGGVVTAPVRPAGPAGPYTLTYSVISENDQHPVTGSISFTLNRPANSP